MSDTQAATPDAFDAAVERVRQGTPEATPEGPGGPPSDDRPPKRGRGRPPGAKTGSGARKPSGWDRWKGKGKTGTPAPASGPIAGPPPPPDAESETPAKIEEPPEIVVEQWAGFVEKIDAMIVAGLDTSPLTPPELRQGGRAVAILMDYYAPKMGATAGPWGPMMVFALTAYGPRAVELAERRIREYVIRRRRARLTAADHIRQEAERQSAPGEPGGVRGSPETFRRPDDPPGFIRVERP